MTQNPCIMPEIRHRFLQVARFDAVGSSATFSDHSHIFAPVFLNVQDFNSSADPLNSCSIAVALLSFFSQRRVFPKIRILDSQPSNMIHTSTAGLLTTAESEAALYQSAKF